jgi:sulfate permease, SulP family
MRLPGPPAISFAPFVQECKEYNFSYLYHDLIAALAVALMTVPQSIAYSLLAGLPPTAGLFSAIFGTIFTAAFGSSRILVSGPSTGTAILIQTAIADVLASHFDGVVGADREMLSLHILAQIVLIMGICHICAGFFNFGKFLQFVSRPVILGYFAGIILAIIISQLFYFTGISNVSGAQSILVQGGFFLSKVLQMKAATDVFSPLLKELA